MFKKELISFLSSPTGYLIMGVFLVATSLFLFIVPGDLNIFYGGYASLSAFFDLAPWIFLFLVPAISMRLIADERRAGTLELLLIRPLSRLQIVGGKYLAGLTLVVLSLVPTVVYVVIVGLLGSPEWNLDMGAVVGSYVGLLLLAAVYMAVGIFASSLTDNSIIAFVLGAVLCFLFYCGFDSIASIEALKGASEFLSACGIASHYVSISRGVIDVRDVVYFLAVVAIFILLTAARLNNSRPLAPLVILAALVAGYFLPLPTLRFDLTAEKRYTLADVTEEKLEDLGDEVLVRFYLDGEMNPGFRRLQKSVVEMLDEFRIHAEKGLSYTIIDPTEMGSARKELDEELAAIGLGGVPVFETKENGQKTRQTLYPYAQIHIGDSYTWVSFLENIPGLNSDENLNRSIEDIEYKLTDAIHQLTLPEDSIPRVAFLEGHGELDELDVLEATEALSAHFAVDRGRIGSDPSILEPYKAVIVAKPAEHFTEAEKYALDQYLMYGGRLLWFVDAVNMTLDTLRNSPHTIGLYTDFNIEDMLFVYGFRVNPEVVEDLNCAMIPISVNNQGEGSQLVPMPWRFMPLLSTNLEHPITRNVSLVRGDFTSYIDTVGGSKLQVTRTPLLRTSSYTKVDVAPVFADLSTIHRQPVESEFNRRHLNVAVLEEGVFPSVFEHRPVPAGIVSIGKRLDKSVPTKMIVVADGDIIRNDVRLRHTEKPTIVPLGYDELSRQTFGNKDFIVNAVQYLADDSGLMALRNRTFVIRLLDRQKLGDTTNYKIISIAIPLLMVALLASMVVFIRIRKYGKHPQ